MAEKLESGGGTQIVDLSALVSVNREIRDYTDKGNVHLKSIVNSLDLIYLRLNKLNFREKTESTISVGAPGIGRIPIGTATAAPQNTSSGNTKLTSGSGATTAIGGGIGMLAGLPWGPVGSAVGNLLGTTIGAMVNLGIGTQGSAAEGKDEAFNSSVKTRYNEAQIAKRQHVDNGSALALANADEKQGNTLQAKIAELNTLESGLDMVAGEEYNKEIEAGIDKKIDFIKNNQGNLEKVYAAIGKNTGRDDAARMASEVRALEDVLQDPYFLENLEKGNSYVVEELFTTGLGNTQVYYERTNAAREKRKMDLYTFKGIGSEFVWDFNNSLYDEQQEFDSFTQEKAKSHGDFLLENFKLPYLEKSEREDLKDKADKASQNWVQTTPYPGTWAPTPGYFLQRFLDDKKEPFNYPAIGDESGIFTWGKENTQRGLYVLPDSQKSSGENSQNSSTMLPSATQQKAETQPTNQAVTYNANVNVAKMEVMDEGKIQTVVDEMLRTLAMAYQVTPQIKNI